MNRLTAWLAAATALAGAGAANTPDTVPISIDPVGAFGNQDSASPSISDDASLVAFESMATNLEADPSDNHCDIFLRNVRTMTTVKITTPMPGTENDGSSFSPQISGDGKFVVFASHSSQLTPGDVNGMMDVFVYDVVQQTIEMVSMSSIGVAASQDSYFPSVSGDGRYIAFESQASDLVVDDNNGCPDIFLRDRLLGVTRRVSISSFGEEGNYMSTHPNVSRSGRYIAFESYATNFVANDPLRTKDIFVHDIHTGATAIANLSNAGGRSNYECENPVVCDNGPMVAFESLSTNLVGGDTNKYSDIFVRDMGEWTTRRVSVSTSGGQADSDSFDPTISADGRYVYFTSLAKNLVTADTNLVSDIFLHDLSLRVTSRVSLGSNGDQADDMSMGANCSADGNSVAFVSRASNLCGLQKVGDTADIYLRTPKRFPKKTSP